MTTDKHYAERDIMEQGQVYCDHVNAMTAEGLHGKSEIAAELAHRDIEISRLRKVIAGNCDPLHMGTEEEMELVRECHREFYPENYE